jgi:hypothetical protein
MAHNPVNHPLRPIYRALSALTGAYLVLFGIVGIIVNSGHDFLATLGEPVLGQHANMLWSILALIIGAIVLVTTMIHHNLDSHADKFLGWAMLVVGSYSLAANRTNANFLGFSMATVIVSYIVGLVLIMCGLYTKTAPRQRVSAPRQEREREVRETQSA